MFFPWEGGGCSGICFYSYFDNRSTFGCLAETALWPNIGIQKSRTIIRAKNHRAGSLRIPAVSCVIGIVAVPGADHSSRLNESSKSVDCARGGCESDEPCA